MNLIRIGILGVCAICLAGNSASYESRSGSGSGPSEAEWQEARSALSDHIRILASDEYQGRMPGTEGGRKTQQYLIDALKSYGFVPGAADGKWRQKVELVRNLPDQARLTATLGSENVEISGQEIIIDGPKLVLDDLDVVYVDIKEKPLKAGELRGKAVVLPLDQYRSSIGQIMVDSPGPILLTTDSFLQHYFSVNTWRNRESWHLKDHPTEGYYPTVALLGHKSSERLARFWAGKPDGRAALTPGPLSGVLKIEAEPKREFIETANVIGKMPGRNPDAGAVLILAHWDHVGVCAPESLTDKICNGAVDNASGTGVMLEVARRLAAGGALDRDIYVMGTTAEELGLLGAEAFIKESPVPLAELVAAFNIDAVAIAPREGPFAAVGWGRTPLDKGIDDVITSSGRELVTRESLEELVDRMDSWAFLKQDIPAVSISSADADEAATKAYYNGPYHKPGDEWSGELELGGATDDIFLHLDLLRHFGSLKSYPGHDRDIPVPDKTTN